MFWLSVLFAVFQSSDPRPAGPPVPALLAQHPCADSEGCNRTIRGSGESQTKSSMHPAHPSSYMKVPVHRYCCPVTELHCKRKVVYSSTWTKGNIRSQVCAPGLVQVLVSNSSVRYTNLRHVRSSHQAFCLPYQTT